MSGGVSNGERLQYIYSGRMKNNITNKPEVGKN